MNRGGNQELGDFIRSRRESRDLTPHQAADRAGLEYSYWNKLENGHYESPSPATLKGIAKALDVSLADLYSLVGYDVTEELPTLRPYLRSKYASLPPAAIADLERYFDLLRSHYGIPEDQPVFPPVKRTSTATKRKAGRPTGSQPNHPWRRAA